MEQATLLEYARLLRQAWLNPSYRPWMLKVCAFEREHSEELQPYLIEWQGKDND
jgi:hypothetical protein